MKLLKTEIPGGLNMNPAPDKKGFFRANGESYCYIDREARKKLDLLEAFKTIHRWSEDFPRASLDSNNTNYFVYLKEILDGPCIEASYHPIGGTIIDEKGRYMGKEAKLKGQFTTLKLEDDNNAYLFIGFGQDWYCITNNDDNKVKIGLPVWNPSNDSIDNPTSLIYDYTMKRCALFYAKSIKLEFSERKIELEMSLLNPTDDARLILIDVR